MTLELIVNLVLALFFLYSYFYVGATMPKSDNTELGAEQWPQAILILLLLALVFNIYTIIKKNRAAGIPMSFSNLVKDAPAFFKSKLFVGMIIVVVMAFALETLGFMVTCLIFLTAYGWLLGERRGWLLGAASVGITALLYVSFAVFLGVMLPRGLVPFLRNFSLFVESIVPRF